ncbi:hypothetical protein BsWGS_27034 [Bradybaena similaris]
MSANNASNVANGPAIIVPKPTPNIVDKAITWVTDRAHFVLRLYFSVLLVIYYWFVKIFTRALQPLEPLLKEMHKIPPGEVNTQGIRSQLTRLVCTVLLFLTPLVNQAIALLTRPLIWARDKVVEYVEQGEKNAAKETNPKQS